MIKKASRQSQGYEADKGKRQAMVAKRLEKQPTQVARGSLDGCGDVTPLCVVQGRQAEVPQVRRVVLVQQDVVRLDVSCRSGLVSLT